MLNYVFIPQSGLLQLLAQATMTYRQGYQVRCRTAAAAAATLASSLNFA
jgi:hypothetical protein